MFSKSKAVVCVALSAAMLLGLTEGDRSQCSDGSNRVCYRYDRLRRYYTGARCITGANTGCGYKQDQVKQENHEPYGRKEDYPESDRNYIHRYLDQQ